MKLKKHNIPTVEQMISTREEYGLSQVAAAKIIYVPVSTWRNWEYGNSSMHPGLWELFNFKIKQ